jgi:hypothetical protein
VSGRTQSAAPVVQREYVPAPDACEKAIEILLKRPMSKAARPAPEPDDRDGTESKEDSASDSLPH